MAGCRIVKASMDQSVTNLLNYSTSYGDAATTFVTAFKAAIESMEGDAKDALLEFFETNIEGFVTNDVIFAASFTVFATIAAVVAACVTGSVIAAGACAGAGTDLEI